MPLLSRARYGESIRCDRGALRPVIANLFRMFSVKLPQGRHPERSASQIYHLTEGLWRAVEGPRRCLLADALQSFPATKIMKEIKKVTASERSASQVSAYGALAPTIAP